MAYKFQIGTAQLSGNLIQEGTVSASDGFGLEGFDLKIQEGKNIGTNADPDLMTLAANSVDVAGDVSASLGFEGFDLLIQSGKTIGVNGDPDLMTLAANSVDVAGDVSASLGLEGFDLLIQAGANIGVNGDADLMTLDANQVSVAGTVSSSVAVKSTSGSIADLLIEDDLHVVDDLTVEGATRFVGDITAASASFTTIFGSGNAQIAGTLRLENAFTMDNVTISDAGAIAGATTISGSGKISGHELDIETNADIEGALNVGASNAFAVDASGQLTACPSGTIADLHVTDDLAVADRLDVGGVSFFYGGNLIVGAAGQFEVTVANGNVDTNGTLTAAGTVSGSIFNFDTTSKAEFARDVLPDIDNVLALGTASKRWKEIYVENVIGASINVETATHTHVGTISSSTGFAIANSATAFQLDLPAGADGKIVRIKNIGAGDITLSASNGAEFIKDETNGDLVVLESEGAAVTCVFSGSAGTGAWYII